MENENINNKEIIEETQKYIERMFEYYTCTSLTELSKILGVTLPTLSKWKGKGYLSSIEKYAKKLNIYDDIFVNWEEGKRAKNNAREIIRLQEQHRKDVQNYNEQRDLLFTYDDIKDVDPFEEEEYSSERHEEEEKLAKEYLAKKEKEEEQELEEAKNKFEQTVERLIAKIEVSKSAAQIEYITKQLMLTIHLLDNYKVEKDEIMSIFSSIKRK